MTNNISFTKYDDTKYFDELDEDAQTELLDNKFKDPDCDAIAELLDSEDIDDLISLLHSAWQDKKNATLEETGWHHLHKLIIEYDYILRRKFAWRISRDLEEKSRYSKDELKLINEDMV